MKGCTPEGVKTVGIVGTGVIGGGWAIHFLAQGLDVIAYDPGPDAQAKLDAMVRNAWPSLTELGLAPGADPARLRFTTDLAEAVTAADVIQESTPEVLASKCDIMARMDALAPAETIILSSTSGLFIKDIQVDCKHPERVVGGHPFNPPYLIPIVEVVGGTATSQSAVDWAADFYTAFGKKVVKMTKEIPGFIANRLQEAMWREMLHMVDNGEATVREIDDAVRFGPGLRWALQGPGMVYHLGGGEGGMAHVLDQFGPALKWPWTRLEAPELTDELRQKMVDGCDDIADGRKIADMIRARDACLIDMMKVIEKHRASGDLP